MKADIHVGDAREVLAAMPSGSVHCCVTSPPYFGLRDYGVAGQLGLEPTLEGYIETMVGVFREVRRVLRSDGTLWLNIGDSFNAYNGGAGPGSKLSKTQTEARPRLVTGYSLQNKQLKPKDLMMVPARLALALQADGWWLRSEIVWAKKAPMPESVTDRPTSSHEKIFLLTKAERYYYDAEAVREKMAPASEARYAYAFGGTKSETLKNADATGMGDHRRPVGERVATSGRNLRNVWHLGPEPFPEAHFATFPTEIPRRAILAGSPQGGTILDPFSGAGTTGVVAGKLGRDYIGIELNPVYAEMSERRILREVGPLLVSVSVKGYV